MWKDIKNYEGLYQVNELGEVLSLKSNKILKNRNNGNGYLMVGLYKDGKLSNKYIHRLVAESFINNPLNLPQVNHKDENKTNNCVSNLEWCDHKYNDNYGTRNQRMGNSKSIKVYQFDLQGNLLNSFRNAYDAANIVGGTQQNINKCCNKVVRTCNGFIWSYDNSIDI